MTSSTPPDMLHPQADVVVQPTTPQTAGQLLREARLAKGMHLGVMSVALKVSVKQLEALEADDHEAFKGPAFLRGVTLSVCRQLGMDPAQVLALLPSPVSSLQPQRTSLDSPAGRGQVTFKGPSLGMPGPSFVFLLSVFLLLGIAGFLWMPAPHVAWPFSAANDAPAAAIDTSVALGQPANPDVTALPAASSPVSTAFEAPIAVPVLQAPSAPARVVFSTEAGLRLEASGTSWIEVKGPQGVLLANQLLKAGDVLEVSPMPPYSVVIGHAAVVQATLRGQSFDLKPHTAATVARFEVKQ